MKAGVLILRADAGVRLGTGHVMRCLALAQAWRAAGGTPLFALGREVPAVRKRLMKERIKTISLGVRPGTAADAEETRRLARRTGADWIVADGYGFGEAFQRRIKRPGGPRLAIIDDDGRASRYAADVVLNQNAGADAGLYRRREPATRLLLGTDYLLLRKEFLPWRARRRAVPKIAKRILVTLGGSDAGNATEEVVRALGKVRVKGLRAVVVAGGLNPHAGALTAAARGAGVPLRIEKNSHDMAKWMVWADMAVAAAGTTAWELAFMGVPSMLTSLADNQRPVARALAARGAAVDLGWRGAVSSAGIAAGMERLAKDGAARALMSRRGRALVDGLGGARVAGILSSVPPVVRLRRAEKGDCRLLWRWANDRSVRRVSFSSRPIPWEDHARWFRAKMGAPRRCSIYIASNLRDVPLGQARFDREGSIAVLSLSVDGKFRGRGYGAEILRESARAFFKEGSADAIHAYVRTGNRASLRAFLKAGFRKAGPAVRNARKAVRFVLRRGNP